MEKTDGAPAQTVILDAGPLIHLDELGSLNLLTDFQERIVPAAVWEEVDRHAFPDKKHPTSLSPSSSSNSSLLSGSRS